MLPVGEPVPPLDAPQQPERRTYEGRFVHLGPVDPVGDADELFPRSHGSDDAEKLWTYMPYGPFDNGTGMQKWMAEIAPSADPMFFTVRHAETGAALGMVSFLNIAAPDRCLELGHIWYVPAAQRTRANTEAAHLMLEEAFERLCCRRVEWKCDSLNAKSRSAALRLGFSFEGIFRQHRIVRQRNRDTAWYSMLDSEWPRARDNLRRWLYDNEDGSLSLTALNRNGTT
ncbi:MAG: GNAT family N-acetyltransferase [Gemmatimonadaceae bacterium]|jgi:RimJ/RimL family protein N-acetyltransferase|nr:GNAT family N-acetyltransferase [Gemmatimonadaceae bacterium]|tara:strand:- start:52 stop:735 length:684 start_codon:yes stop_codon:yes gene_type:complete